MVLTSMSFALDVFEGGNDDFLGFAKTSIRRVGKRR